MPDYPNAPKYVRSIQDRRLPQAGATLQEWGEAVHHPQSLSEEYAQGLDQLASAGPEVLRCLVDGKMVINTLLGEFQKVRPGKSYEYSDYITHYLDKCPDPPQEAADLVERILVDAHAFLAGTAPPPLP